jgi:hypothetical protein
MNEYQSEVASHFGYWPEFCDAPILSFKIDDTTLNLRLRYIDSDKKRRAEIEFTFHGLSDVDMDEFVENSVIDTLTILRAGSHHSISIEPCFGFGGTFKCIAIEAKLVGA